MEPIRISFCITCKGRLYQLRETLPANIAANEGFPGTEFVLLNYSSPDALDEWVKAEMGLELESGRLVYFKASGYKKFFPSHAKNVAHRLARGEILCNLDADSFCGAGFARYLDEVFKTSEGVFVRAKGIKGLLGRIALRKSDFEKLGGYDERMRFGWGYDDTDLALRAQAMGLRQVEIPCDSGFVGQLFHSDAERMQFMGSKNILRSQKKHRDLSRQCLARGWLTANVNQRWGSAKLEKNFFVTLEI